MLCQCCDQTLVPDKFKGYYAGAVLTDLRDQVQELRRERPYYGHDSWITTDAYNEALDDVLALLDGGESA
jgi:hypothetical protein